MTVALAGLGVVVRELPLPVLDLPWEYRVIVLESAPRGGIDGLCQLTLSVEQIARNAGLVALFWRHVH